MTPLAEKLRPKTLENFVGQEHLVGENKPIYEALKNQQIFSMILWGGSGTGKTTLARIISTEIKANFIELSAVLVGVKELREVIENAKLSKNLKKETVVFIDEIHHFNKSQQDILLPHIESGLITLIGATTENPSFELNNAILSRVVVFTLNPLTDENLRDILKNAIDLDTQNQNLIIASSSGDARKMLGIVERIKDINPQEIKNYIGENLASFDKGGDIFYQQLSAFHKCVRSSSVDGSLYWFARMLEAGADATIVARRLLAIASEDIGLADPKALEITLTSWDIYHRVGKKEGERAIAQAVVYCAIASKSNAIYKAFNEVSEFVKGDNSAVPKHLCNATSKTLKDLGFGEGYKYAHNFENGLVENQTYFPKQIGEQTFYNPTTNGVEDKIKQRLEKINNANKGKK
jgi:putative ATPase